MITVDLAAKKALRLSLSGAIELQMDDKKVELKNYHNQQQRKNLIAGWYERYQLSQNSFALIIKPKI